MRGCTRTSWIVEPTYRSHIILYEIEYFRGLTNRSIRLSCSTVFGTFVTGLKLDILGLRQTLVIWIALSDKGCLPWEPSTPREPVQIRDSAMQTPTIQRTERVFMGTVITSYLCGSNHTNCGNQSNSRGLNKYTCWRMDENIGRFGYITRVMNTSHESCDWRELKYDISSPDTSIV